MRNATSKAAATDSTINGMISGAAEFTLSHSRITGAWDDKGTVNLTDGSVWNVTGAPDDASEKLDALSLTDSTLNLLGGDMRTASLSGNNGHIFSAWNEETGAFQQLSADTATGDFTVGIASTGKAATDAMLSNTLVHTGGGDATFTGSSDIGAWQYDAVAQANAAGGTDVGLQKSDRLSTGANAALSAASAAVNNWNIEADTLNQRLNASRLAQHDEGGVWASYFGGHDNVTTGAGADYQQRTNGVMLGADTLLDAKHGQWLAGVAFSQGKSDLSMRNASGNLKDTGVQAYLSRRYDNGVFIDTAAKIARFSGDHRVYATDGAKSDASYDSNGYGASMKGGYTWKQDRFFVEPYLKASLMTLDGMDYTTTNGMAVHSDSYTSVRGEAGTDLGATWAFNGKLPGTVSPYLHLAAVNEFSDGNTVSLNGESFNDSIDGAAFVGGAGVRVALDAGLGLWTNLNYAKGQDTESPWQMNAGMSWTW
ncbi:autotransporter outer membrane beta-barrel domain-containing protein [Serratia quinivorans]|uniref:autotransporter outer membrane beta-barrel domain-containing protein n=1 Tax=Serratia quinivorans TaxID=137545 RepID=UPI0021BA4961|nr:autotransporter outer membrane beta-barrel domain-containing protein [Serratia quinivorans]